MTRPAPRLPHMRCPHCGERAFARNSGKTTETYREIYYHCRALLTCGHVFVVGMEILRTIRPSAMPNPEIRLPITAYRPANDHTPPAANDDQPEPLPPAANRGIADRN